ncbi:hypothetical protein KKG46_01680 [Patescibacteria group bacterium]|nr:hypothetical protein [Patescibacteria group bacterium]
MILKGIIKQRVNDLINLLQIKQLEDGSFLSLSSNDKNDFKDSYEYVSPFPVSLIMIALSGLDVGEDIMSKASGFLRSQIGADGSVNYYKLKSLYYNKFQYPDDLDCTFCTHSGLVLYNNDYIDGEMMAKVAKILTSYEHGEGGPYKTWMVPENSDQVWKDVDLAVNANIQYFLSLQEVELPNIQSMIDEAILADKIESPYYTTPFSVLYFIARMYNGSYKKELIQIVKNNITKIGLEVINPLDLSFVLIVLIDLGVDATVYEELVKKLLEFSLDDIDKPYAYVIDPAIDGKQYYAGCDALTIAINIQALNKYLDKTFDNQKVLANEDVHDEYYTDILNSVKEVFSGLDKGLEKRADIRLETLVKNDKDGQIALMPRYFYQSMNIETTDLDDLVKKLCQASLFGWLAYSIYDDFFDGDGQAEDLSVANVSLRHCAHIFEEMIVKYPTFQQLYNQIMNALDSSNCWEINNCRLSQEIKILDLSIDFPSYLNSQFTDRSLGHALGACLLLIATDNQNQIDKMLCFFKKYLLVRQLHDDMHDWEDDLSKGIVNSVHSSIFKDWQTEFGKNVLNIESDLVSLQNVFWNKTIDKLCGYVSAELDTAKEILLSIDAIKDKGYFIKLLDSMKVANREILQQRDDVLRFIESYK